MPGMNTICKNSVTYDSPWWTEELHNNKKIVRALRKRFQTCYYQRLRLIYQQEYKEARSSYSRLVKNTKKEYWKNYFGLAEHWDEAKLKELVEKKHGKSELKKPKTAILCKYFLDALENYEYGWVWRCPNGENKCPDRHALPPGFILKKDRKKGEKTEQLSVEDLVKKQNVACSGISSEFLSIALNNVESGTAVSQRCWENHEAVRRRMSSEEDNKDVAPINKNLHEEDLGDLDEELLNFLKGLSPEDMKSLKDFCELINFFRELPSEDLKKLKDFIRAVINFFKELTLEDLKNFVNFCKELLNFFKELLDFIRGLSEEDLENLRALCELINFFRGLSSEDLKNLKEFFCELSSLMKLLFTKN